MRIIFRAPVNSDHGDLVAAATLQHMPICPNGDRMLVMVVVSQSANQLHHSVLSLLAALVAMRPHQLIPVDRSFVVAAVLLHSLRS